MPLDLSDEEKGSLAELLKRTIEADHSRCCRESAPCKRSSTRSSAAGARVGAAAEDVTPVRVCARELLQRVARFDGRADHFDSKRKPGLLTGLFLQERPRPMVVRLCRPSRAGSSTPPVLIGDQIVSILEGRR